jgi:hypothetical protein
MTIDEYISTYCAPSTQKVGMNIPISSVEMLGLKIILFSISQIERSASLHQATCL